MAMVHRVASRYIQAKEDEALDAIIDAWADAFLGALLRVPIQEADIERALLAGA